MELYKITKKYRNGKDEYFIRLDKGEKVTEEMLESIGDATDGGSNYGYTVDAEPIKRLPKGATLLPREVKTRLY